MCVYHLSVISMPRALHIEQRKRAQTLSCLIKYSIFAKMGHPEVRWSIDSSSCLHNHYLLLLSLSLSPLFRVFTIISLKLTVFLGYIVLQLFFMYDLLLLLLLLLLVNILSPL
jgi:hypothetical protein